MKVIVIFLLIVPFFSYSKARKSSIDKPDVEKEECAYTAQGDRYNEKWRKLMNSLAIGSSNKENQDTIEPQEASSGSSTGSL